MSIARAIHESLLSGCSRAALHAGGYSAGIDELDRLERLQPEDLEAETMRRAQALLQHAFSRVPYYRDLARERRLVAGDFRTQGDLSELPVLTKAII